MLQQLRRGAVEAAVRLAAPLVRGRQAAIDPQRIQRILVLQLQQVGDTMIFSPTLVALRKRFPDARIDLLVNGIAEQLYRSCPLVDHLYVDRWSRYGERKIVAMRPLLRELRANRYDVVIADVTQRSFRFGLIAYLTGAPVRIGFDDEGHGVFFSHRVVTPPNTSFLDANLQLASALGADVNAADEAFFFSEDDARQADELLSEVPDGEGPLVLVHPASNWQSKTWFADRWAAVADALTRDEGARIAFVGTNAESPYVEEIRAKMSAPSWSFAGRTTLTQLGALLARGDLFIGTDSGPRHIAGALKRPQVTVMSSLDYPHRWTLARANERVLRTDPECGGCQLMTCSHRTCMDRIQVAQVLEAARELLAHTTRARSTAA